MIASCVRMLRCTNIRWITLTSLRSQRLVVLGQLLQVESNEKEEQRKKRKREHELMDNMQNMVPPHSAPTIPIPYRNRFGVLMADPNRQYVKRLTHMYSWEIVELAELLKPYISAPRTTSWRPTPKNPPGLKRVISVHSSYFHVHFNRLTWVGCVVNMQCRLFISIVYLVDCLSVQYCYY